MSAAKVVFIAPSFERLIEIVEKHSLDEYIVSGIGDGRLIVASFPQHHHTRFALAEEEGVVVIPGAHAPEPVGDLHKHLAHIDAKPHHTARDTLLRLHAKHGSDLLHPDV